MVDLSVYTNHRIGDMYYNTKHSWVPHNKSAYSDTLFPTGYITSKLLLTSALFYLYYVSKTGY
jgi:hypothetical protein